MPAALTSPSALSAPPPAVREPELDLAGLSALTRSLAARRDLWEPLVRYRPGERWWTRLAAPAGVDVWLLSWLAQQGTELHDHGTSGAAFTVVRGSLTEIRPDDAGRLVPQAFGTGATQTVAVGERHDVVNRDAEPAVSIHAYSPRLTRMTYWAQVDGVLVPSRVVESDEPEEDR